MKIHGRKISTPEPEVVVIPRPEGDLVFMARAVLNYEEHDKLNPLPTPPERILPGGSRQQNIEHPGYKKALSEWANRKSHYTFLMSLSATDGLEFETVDMQDPATWGNYLKEMEEAGLSQTEIARIQEIVLDACGLNQSKIDEATKRFLLGRAQAKSNGSFHASEQQNTPSGESVSASA